MIKMVRRVSRDHIIITNIINSQIYWLLISRDNHRSGGATVTTDCTFWDFLVPTSLQRLSQPQHKVETSKFTSCNIFAIPNWGLIIFLLEKMFNYENEVVENENFQKRQFFVCKLIAGTEDTVYIKIFHHSGNFGILLN